jgi:hypothetical protein
LCQTLSPSRFIILSSFADKPLPSGALLFFCFVAYIMLRTFRLD